jgi:hypothetical protein
MLKAGGVKDATSKWASAPVFIWKHDGSVRYCIDYRKLNSRHRFRSNEFKQLKQLKKLKK